MQRPPQRPQPQPVELPVQHNTVDDLLTSPSFAAALVLQQMRSQGPDTDSKPVLPQNSLMGLALGQLALPELHAPLLQLPPRVHASSAAAAAAGNSGREASVWARESQPMLPAQHVVLPHVTSDEERTIQAVFGEAISSHPDLMVLHVQVPAVPGQEQLQPQLQPPPVVTLILPAGVVQKVAGLSEDVAQPATAAGQLIHLLPDQLQVLLKAAAQQHVVQLQPYLEPGAQVPRPPMTSAQPTLAPVGAGALGGRMGLTSQLPAVASPFQLAMADLEQIPSGFALTGDTAQAASSTGGAAAESHPVVLVPRARAKKKTGYTAAAAPPAAATS
eukprot:jgi/Chrzof1/824/Cz01g30080.t1